MRLGHPRCLGTYCLADSVVIFVYSKAYQILSDPVSSLFVLSLPDPFLYRPRHTSRSLLPHAVDVFYSHLSLPLNSEPARGIRQEWREDGTPLWTIQVWVRQL